MTTFGFPSEETPAPLITNHLQHFQLSGDDMLAFGLTMLRDTRITDHGIAVRSGYQTLDALRTLDESGVYIGDDELWYRGEFLVQLGFAERHPERGDGAWKYRITPLGKAFLGTARHSWRLPGWIALVCGDWDAIHINLRSYDHVALMRRLLAAGWTVEKRS